MSGYIIPDPTTLSWGRFAETLINFNPTITQQVTPDSLWEEFANRLALQIPQIPRPDLYDTWQAWAVGLKQALQG